MKGKTHLPRMFILQLVSQQPFAEDTPGSSHQLLKSDKIPLQLILPAESSRLTHKRLSLLTWLCRLIYLFTPNVHLGCTTMKIGVCKRRRRLSEGRTWLGMQRQGLGSIRGGTGHGPPLLPGFSLPPRDQPTTILLLLWSRWYFLLRRTWDTSPQPPTTPAGFPPQPGPNAALLLCSLHPSTATLSRRMHTASHAHLSFPHSLIATLPVFPEFYIAFTVCFYDV